MDIKEIRKHLGLTQKEFAEKYKIPLPTLRHWEQGVSAPPVYFTSLLESVIVPKDDTSKYITKEQYLYNICRMENIRVKREEMKDIADRIVTESVKAEDIPKINNILRAFAYSVNLSAFKGNETVCEINRLIEYGRDDGMEGQIRNTPVKITGCNYKPPLPERRYFSRKIKQLSQKADKTDSSIELLLYLMKSQIFADGNKRTAQLSSLSMLKDTEYVVSIPFAKQKIFAEHLIRYYEDENYKSTIKSFIIENALMKREDF